jgi:SpoVK/Ycf46/Vps4 family AAA+-type ATPase
VAGVEAAYHFLKSALIEQQEHVLLSGPVGVGKASLARRIAAELGRPLLFRDCGDLGAGGESGEGLNQLFATATRVAGETLFEKKGCVVLLENVEALGGRQSGGLGGGPGLLAGCLERWPGRQVAGPGRLAAGPGRLEAGLFRQVVGPGRLTVICTTSRPEEVDSSLRRPGRLGLEFTMKVKCLIYSVPDPSPDPPDQHVFGRPGSGSISQSMDPDPLEKP